jgi:threonine dehydratase
LIPAEIRGVEVWCKAESLHPVGAFKIRGAWHRLTDLSDEERARGVVAVSSVNHAQGVSWAARRLGVPATLVMPNDAPEVKLAGTRALGAEVVLYDRPGGESRDEVAARLVDKSGATLVHAYGDPWVIEGQGSTGIEIAAQLGEEPTQDANRLAAEQQEHVAIGKSRGVSGRAIQCCPDEFLANVVRTVHQAGVRDPDRGKRPAPSIPFRIQWA